VAVTHDDVRHIANLARLGIDPSRLDDLVRELNGILVHMEVLQQVDTGDAEDDARAGAQSTGTPLRSDSSGPIPMQLPLESFAPAMRDGFITVSRLEQFVSADGDAELESDERLPGTDDAASLEPATDAEEDRSP
jgi:aspartyl-tRNA(Asn)/glutamyl-tRNA(Gln) amidotransferase subunit C